MRQLLSRSDRPRKSSNHCTLTMNRHSRHKCCDQNHRRWWRFRLKPGLLRSRVNLFWKKFKQSLRTEPEPPQEAQENSETPDKRTAQIMAEIRRNISSKKRPTQKDRDDKELEKSKKVNEILNNLIKQKEPIKITKESDEPGNVFDYSFKQAAATPSTAIEETIKEPSQRQEVKSPVKATTPPPPTKPAAVAKKVSVKPKTKSKAPSEPFYFPYGKIRPKSESDLFIIALDEFAKENKKQIVTIDDMGEIVREMKLPFYWKEPLFRASGGRPDSTTTIIALGTTWKKICSSRFDAESQFWDFQIINYHIFLPSIFSQQFAHPYSLSFSLCCLDPMYSCPPTLSHLSWTLSARIQAWGFFARRPSSTRVM